jgi:hypothetical protein
MRGRVQRGIESRASLSLNDVGRLLADRVDPRGAEEAEDQNSIISSSQIALVLAHGVPSQVFS